MPRGEEYFQKRKRTSSRKLIHLYKWKGRQALEGGDINQKHLRSNNLVINCNCSSCNDSKSIYTWCTTPNTLCTSSDPYALYGSGTEEPPKNLTRAPGRVLQSDTTWGVCGLCVLMCWSCFNAANSWIYLPAGIDSYLSSIDRNLHSPQKCFFRTCSTAVE